MTKQEIKRLEKLLRRFDQFANARCARLAKWFAKKFPRHSLEIKFGMGSEYVEVDGRTVWLDGAQDKDNRPVLASKPTKTYGRRCAALIPIQDALIDVVAITDGYRRGCPDDVKVNLK